MNQVLQPLLRQITDVGRFILPYKWKLLPPTIRHLEMEVYLLGCMMLLCIATIRSLYKEESSLSLSVLSYFLTLLPQQQLSTTTTTPPPPTTRIENGGGGTSSTGSSSSANHSSYASQQLPVEQSPPAAFHFEQSPLFGTTTASSSSSSSSSSSGELQFICLLFLLLSRHVLYRYFCTWDPSSHVTPSILGCISHFLQTTFIGTATTTIPPHNTSSSSNSSSNTGSHSHATTTTTGSKSSNSNTTSTNLTNAGTTINYPGQTFDRPPPPIQLAIVLQQQQQQQGNLTFASLSSSMGIGGSAGGGFVDRTMTTSHHNNHSNVMSTSGGGGGGIGAMAQLSSSAASATPSATDRMIHLTSGLIETTTTTSRVGSSGSSTIGSNKNSTNETTTRWSHILPSSGMYAIQMVRKFIWFPLTRYMMGGTPQWQHHHWSHWTTGSINYYYNVDDEDDGDDDHNNNTIINDDDDTNDYAMDTTTSNRRERHNNKGGFRNTTVSNTTTSIATNRTVSNMVRYLVRKCIWIYHSTIQFLFLYGPSIQFLLSIKLCKEIAVLYYSSSGDSSNIIFGDNYNYFGANTFRQYMTKQNLFINTHDVKKMLQVAEQESASMIGTYIPQLKPTWSDVMLVAVAFSTVYSLVVFARIIFPFPDLLANGSSVGKDTTTVRHSNTATGPTTTNSGSGSKKGHHHHNQHHSHHHHHNQNSNTHHQNNRHSNTNFVGGWLSNLSVRWNDWFNSNSSNNKNSNRMKSSVTSNIDTISWIGRQCTTMTTNRLHVCILVVVGRVIENVIIVGILPRTQFACRFMGHCQTGLSLWELSRILYPGGLNTPQRTDGLESNESMESDVFSALWTVLAVFVTSMVLLLAQTLVLNRSYLSMSAYHSLEWELESKETKKSQRQSDYSDLPWLSSSHHQSPPDVWDVRRKYVKGDVVYYPDWFGALYRARVNSPEGHPKSNPFRAINQELLMELGNPATSRILASLASIQFVCAFCYFLMWTIFVLCGWHWHTYGLIWATMSCCLAVHGVLSTTRRASYTTISKNGTRRTSPAWQTLQKLSREIMKNNY